MKFRASTIQKICLTSIILMALLFGLIRVERAHADINPMLNFAGKVTNLDGSEIADGTYDFSFGLYASSTGGTALWSESQNAATMFSATVNGNITGTNILYTGDANANTLHVGQYLTNSTLASSSLIVAIDTSAKIITIADGVAWHNGDNINNRPYVTGGVIDANYGIVDNSITSVNFNQPLYLQVTFNSEVMQPRQLLASVPYAFNAAQLGGKTADQFVNTIDNTTINGAWTFDNIINIAATSSSAALTVTQNGTGNIVEFKQGATTSLAVLNSGLVQIGQYIFPYAHGGPGTVLIDDGNGNLSWGTPTGAGTVNSGLAGQIAYYGGNGTILSASPLIYLATTTQQVGIGTAALNVMLQVGTATPSYVSGYRDTFLSGALEVGGQLYVSGGGSSIFAGSINAIGGIKAGSLIINNSGLVTSGTWHGDMISASYGGTGSSTLNGILKGNGTGAVQTAILGTDYVNNAYFSGTAPISYSNGAISLSVPGQTANDLIYYNGASWTRLPMGASGLLGYNYATGNLGYLATSTLGIALSDTTGTLQIARGGTGNTGFATGSIIFSNGTILTQDNSNFYWDNVKKELGVGTSTLVNGAALTVGGDLMISGNITPIGSTSVGTAGARFSTGYFDKLYVNQEFIASTSISGTAGNTFTINSANTLDQSDSNLEFYRGSGYNSALLKYNHSTGRFELNAPLYVFNGVNTPGSGYSSITVKAGDGQNSQPLLQWQDNLGNTLGVVNGSGYLGLGTNVTLGFIISRCNFQQSILS